MIEVDLNATMPWVPPKRISDDLRVEAQTHLNFIERYASVPSADAAKKWLIGLAPLLAGNNSATDLELKLMAFSQMLDYPAFCYTPDSLRDFARKQKFFPTFSELCDHFELVKKTRLIERDRCRVLLSPPAKEIQPLTREDIPRHEWTAEHWRDHFTAQYKLLAIKVGLPQSMRGNLAEQFKAVQLELEQANAKFQSLDFDDEALRLVEIISEEIEREKREDA